MASGRAIQRNPSALGLVTTRLENCHYILGVLEGLGERLGQDTTGGGAIRRVFESGGISEKFQG